MMHLTTDDVLDLKYKNDLEQLQINPYAVKKTYVFEFKPKATQVILNEFSLYIDLKITF